MKLYFLLFSVLFSAHVFSQGLPPNLSSQLEDLETNYLSYLDHQAECFPETQDAINKFKKDISSRMTTFRNNVAAGIKEVHTDLTEQRSELEQAEAAFRANPQNRALENLVKEKKLILEKAISLQSRRTEEAHSDFRKLYESEITALVHAIPLRDLYVEVKYSGKDKRKEMGMEIRSWETYVTYYYDKIPVVGERRYLRSSNKLNSKELQRQIENSAKESNDGRDLFKNCQTQACIFTVSEMVKKWVADLYKFDFSEDFGTGKKISSPKVFNVKPTAFNQQIDRVSSHLVKGKKMGNLQPQCGGSSYASKTKVNSIDRSIAKEVQTKEKKDPSQKSSQSTKQ